MRRHRAAVWDRHMRTRSGGLDTSYAPSWAPLGHRLVRSRTEQDPNGEADVSTLEFVIKRVVDGTWIRPTPSANTQ